jgi:hypothetical protein
MFKFLALCFFLFILIGVVQSMFTAVVALLPALLLLLCGWAAYRLVR